MRRDRGLIEERAQNSAQELDEMNSQFAKMQMEIENLTRVSFPTLFTFVLSFYWGKGAILSDSYVSLKSNNNNNIHLTTLNLVI